MKKYRIINRDVSFGVAIKFNTIFLKRVNSPIPVCSNICSMSFNKNLCRFIRVGREGKNVLIDFCGTKKSVSYYCLKCY